MVGSLAHAGDRQALELDPGRRGRQVRLQRARYLEQLRVPLGRDPDRDAPAALYAPDKAVFLKIHEVL